MTATDESRPDADGAGAPPLGALPLTEVPQPPPMPVPAANTGPQYLEVQPPADSPQQSQSEAQGPRRAQIDDPSEVGARAWSGPVTKEYTPPPLASPTPEGAEFQTPFRTGGPLAEEAASYFSGARAFVEHRPWSTVVYVLAWVSAGAAFLVALLVAFLSNQLVDVIAEMGWSSAMSWLMWVMLASALLSAGWALLLRSARSRADDGQPTMLFAVAVAGVAIFSVGTIGSLGSLLIGGGSLLNLAIQVATAALYVRLVMVTRPTRN